MPTLTGIHHVDFTVTDIEQSVPWYSEIFGLTKIMDEPHHPDGRGYSVVLLHPEGQFCIGLSVHQIKDGGRFSEQLTGLDHVSFAVRDRAELEAWEARLDSLGVAHSGITDKSWGSVIVFRDPDNIQLELIHLTLA